MTDFRFPHRQDTIIAALAGAQVATAIQLMQENDTAVEDALAARPSAGVADSQESPSPVSPGGTFSGTWNIGGNRPYLGVLVAKANGDGEIWAQLDGGDGKSDGWSYGKSNPSGGDAQVTSAALVFGAVPASFEVEWAGASPALITVSLMAVPLA